MNRLPARISTLILPNISLLGMKKEGTLDEVFICRKDKKF